MKEYLLYTVLICLPMGGLMSVLLYKQGLQKRSISIMVFISLLIVVSSPIIMQKIGFWLSFIIFIFIIAILSRRLVTDYSVLVACCDESGEVNANELTRIDSIYSMNENSSKILYPRDLEADITNASNKVQAIQETMEIEIPVAPEADITNASNKVQAIQETMEIVIPVAPEAHTTIVSNEVQAIQETIVIEIPVDPEVDTTIVNNEIQAIQETIEIELPEMKIEVQEGENVKLEDLAKAYDSPDLVLTDILEQDLMPPEKTVFIDAPDQVMARQDELLNQGFEGKIRGDLTLAIQCFKEACNLTDDKELQALLILEVVNLLKDDGRYKEAEDFLAFKIDASTCGPEIYDQYHYMRILHSELLRFGMDSIPLRTVPRWVKMNVSDKMNKMTEQMKGVSVI